MPAQPSQPSRRRSPAAVRPNHAFRPKVDTFEDRIVPAVFINEIHYDDLGADDAEGVEVAGDAGTDLSGWSIVLYNGSNGTTYGTVNLSGTIPNQSNGFGTINFTQAGIQNGAPDGLALVNGSGTVIQFLSYEGEVVATDGPAIGMTSADIGVSETSSTPDGQSLQLTGNGSAYSDFTWATPATATPGAINNNQTFAAPSGSTVTIAATDADKAEGNSGTTAFTFTVTRTGDTSSSATVDYVVTGSGSDPADAADFGGTFPTGMATFAATESTAIITVNVTGDTTVEPDEGFTVTISNPTGGLTLGSPTAADGTIQDDDAPPVTFPIVINEILADPNSTTENFDTDGNGSADTSDEFVEIYNSSGTPVDISGFRLWDPSQGNWFTFPGAPGSNTTVLGAGNYAVVVTNIDSANGGSLPAVTGGNLAFSSGGAGSLSNTGDNVVVYDPISDTYIQAVYNSAAPDVPQTEYTGFSTTAIQAGPTTDFGNDVDGVSLTRNPAGSDTIVVHNTITNAPNASPGGPAVASTPAPGVTVTENGGSTDVAEGGATDTFDVVLDTAPTADVTVTITPDADTDLGNGAGAAIALTFTPANFDTPQTVTVTAVDDADVEGAHTSTIAFTTASSDAGYNGLTIPDLTANVTDNDFATADLGVTITDDMDPITTGGSTVYTVVVTNTGPDAATGAGLDTAVSFPAGTFTVSGAGLAFSGGGTGTLATGADGAPDVTGLTLASGETATLTFTVTADTGTGTITTTATVSAGTPADTNAVNDTATQTTIVDAVPTADLGVTVTDGTDPITTGGSTTYTVVVTNNGPTT